MVIGMIIIILVLITVISWQYKRERQLRASVHDVTTKLRDVRHKDTDERLLMVTGDHTLKELLMESNAILDQKFRSKVLYRRREKSIKTMLSNISHDMKTPLTVILGYTETLQQYPDMAKVEREHLLEQMNNKTLEIIDMMNTFFDLAKLESEDQNMPLQRVNVTEVCKHSLLSFYDWIQTNALEPIITIPEDPVYTWGNEEALARVMQNLLANAIRYGRDGHVIGLSLTYDATEIVIMVWDKGQGIPKTMQEHIFERMFTVEESRNKAFQGSGLGLAITKKLVEDMSGTITVQSTPYQKTTFTITLQRHVY